MNKLVNQANNSFFMDSFLLFEASHAIIPIDKNLYTNIIKYSIKYKNTTLVKPEYQSLFDPIRYNENVGIKKRTSTVYIAMLKSNKNFS